MADQVKGKLALQAGKLRVVFPTKKGSSLPAPVPDDQLHPALRAEAATALEGREVELDLEGGLPKRIRPVGEPWPVAVIAASVASPGGAPSATAAGFLNPYGFVPFGKRGPAHPSLGDHLGAPHGVFGAALWSGQIDVVLTTETPLLIPDGARAKIGESDHKSMPARIGADGRPYLPPTSIKGMLRAAYEAVTNSRMGVFRGHDRPLARRMQAKEGLKLVPVRIERDGDQLVARLLPGTSTIGDDGTVRGPMYAAWLPAWDKARGGPSREAVRFANGQSPRHLDRVVAWVELWEKKQERGGFKYWKVRSLAKDGAELAQPAPGRPSGRHAPVGELKRIEGFVCIGNKNIDGKHDERVFFVEEEKKADPSLRLTLSERDVEAWDHLITNYQEIHQRELDRGAKGPPALNSSVWSRHVVGGDTERELKEGTLCFAGLSRQGSVLKLRALYPVMIARELYTSAPAALVPSTIGLATALGELSPADRVFGWVASQGQGAYRGNLRLGPVTCETGDALVSFAGEGVPLAILGEPKPQQARFYVDAGSAQPAPDYAPGASLKGRKVYLHHASLPPEYWNLPMQDRTQTPVAGRYQEYRRPMDGGKEQRDDQNRSVSSWVRPGTRFTFSIDVTNLDAVELGALAWLLTLPKGHFHRLGSAKSLGFGSVRIEVASAALSTGADLAEALRALREAPARAEALEVSKKAFAEATAKGQGKPRLEEVPFIRAFLVATAGIPGQSVHYPRLGEGGACPPSPAGESFKWFVANSGKDGLKVSLAKTDAPAALPYLPKGQGDARTDDRRPGDRGGPGSNRFGPGGGNHRR